MKYCDTCGNEIEDKARICPYCLSEQQLVDRDPGPAKPRIRKSVIKEGQPTVAEAIERLKSEVASARTEKIHVLKIVQGYGSSGKGGAIKNAVLSRLASWHQKGEIRNYLTGEQHFDQGARHNYLLRKYPELKETWISDRGNPGITFIEL
jgi:hypothetical protein